MKTLPIYGKIMTEITVINKCSPNLSCGYAMATKKENDK